MASQESVRPTGLQCCRCRRTESAIHDELRQTLDEIAICIGERGRNVIYREGVSDTLAPVMFGIGRQDSQDVLILKRVIIKIVLYGLTYRVRCLGIGISYKAASEGIQSMWLRMWAQEHPIRLPICWFDRLPL